MAARNGEWENCVRTCLSSIIPKSIQTMMEPFCCFFSTNYFWDSGSDSKRLNLLCYPKETDYLIFTDCFVGSDLSFFVVLCERRSLCSIKYIRVKSYVIRWFCFLCACVYARGIEENLCFES